MEPWTDYYALLGSSPSATREELRIAYLETAGRFHPERNQSPGVSLALDTLDRAYRLLSDPEQRQEYDRLRQRLPLDQPGLSVEVVQSSPALAITPGRQAFDVKLNLLLAPQPASRVDTPVNLCMVVDRSKSMASIPLQRIKSVVHRLIDDCFVADILALVAFSDQAELVIPAQHVSDPRMLKAMALTIRADGSTRMLDALKMALTQIERYRGPRYTNHVILFTDGATYGDSKECLELLAAAAERGISFSIVSVGENLQVEFLNRLATVTGGGQIGLTAMNETSAYLANHVRPLSQGIADHAQLVIAPAAEARLVQCFSAAFDPRRFSIDTQPFALRMLEGGQPVEAALRFSVETDGLPPGEMFIARASLRAVIGGGSPHDQEVFADIAAPVSA